MRGVSDLPGVRRVLTGGRSAGGVSVEPRSLYGTFVYPGDTVFDIGAHHGFRTDGFLQLGVGCAVADGHHHAHARAA